MTNQQLPDRAGVIMFPPLLYFITLIIGIASSYFFPYQLLPQTTAIVLGIALFVLGVIGVRFAAGLFVRRKTTVNPSGATTLIVHDGIFKYTRNPMYVSFTLIIAGIAIALNAWVTLILIIPLLIIVQKGIIEREEHYLTRKFGNEYLAYKNAVRRWV